MLLTLEDFAFFVDEFRLPVPHEQLEELAASAASVRYAMIELIESIKHARQRDCSNKTPSPRQAPP